MNPGWMDRLGSLASFACAMHCLILAAVPSLVSALGLGREGHEQVEWVTFAFAVCFGLGAAVWGYRRHRVRWISAGLGGGIVVLFAGRLGEVFHISGVGFGLTVLGGMLLAGFHLLSLRQLRTVEASCCP